MEVTDDDLQNEIRHKSNRQGVDARRPPMRKALVGRAMDLRLLMVSRIVRERAEVAAQHGQVKIIMKDGKRCL
jgi:hypothetical protein